MVSFVKSCVVVYPPPYPAITPDALLLGRNAVSLSHAAVTCPSKAVLAAEKVEKEEIDKKAAEKSVEGSPQEAENGSGEEKGRKNIERDDKKATELTEKECENDGDVGVKSTPESTPDGARQDADEDGGEIFQANIVMFSCDLTSSDLILVGSFPGVGRVSQLNLDFVKFFNPCTPNPHFQVSMHIR